MINWWLRFWQYQRGRFLWICKYETPRLISSVPSHNPTFVSHHFTEAEITHCRSQPSPPLSFAARWVGKEAVFKSLSVKSKGVTAAMKDIEIVNDESSVPAVHLHGEAKAGATGKFEHFTLFTDLKSFFLFPSFFWFMLTCAYLCYLAPDAADLVQRVW